ncbi:helix-turn-helix transcriptional regulator [Actinomycetospora cinnamomea]|uniref:LuxR family maltose regulon positive regulatory protein n=1 Tax=Actinomycetospora cinnamomea TaxID=663609 RepID=A0A2U1EDP9_9PSEU|nr:LuxR C-terminal-related transcriptional regulator [Actinomycetospora cinnamomea]PVY97992.1 LuxR family maltose regulon positive regulatory protein [Actinomycetospora cinnamomea]
MRQGKVEVPLRPPRFVPREEVRDALDSAAAPAGRGRVVLVSAPAGHGKTAALADWVRTGGPPAAWVSLDHADRDEHQWWSSVLGALLTCPAVPSDAALHRVAEQSRGRETEAHEAFLVTLLDALDELPEPVRMVLDDVHSIIGHPAQRGLRDLVRHPVRGLTVVLSSRCDPPIGLDHLRLHDRLGEVRADRLAFGIEDAVRLFDAASVPLTPDQAATLVERTEGWVAALRLLALSLRSATDQASVVADFAGDDRSVADYLVDEVLSTLDDRQRRVLEAACLRPTVPADLTRALAGGDAAADVLEHLEATTGMVTAVDRRGERYHAHELLRSHVLARLRRAHPERLRAMHQRAAVWFEVHDEPAEAVGFAAAAGDVAGTTSLVRARGAELVAAGRFTELGEAVHLLCSREDAAIPPVLALAVLEDGGPDRAEALLRPEDGTDPEIAIVRSMVGARRLLAEGHGTEAHDAAGAVVPEATGNAALRALALANRATVLAETAPHAACTDAEGALALARAEDWPWLEVQAHAALATAHARADRLPDAVQHAHAVLERTARHRWQHTAWPAGALIVLARSDAVGGRPEQALADVAAAEALEPTHREHRVVLTAVRGVAEYDRGRRREGWQLLRAARLQALADEVDARELAFAALLEQQAALGLGRVGEAREVTTAVAARLAGTADEAVLQARQRWATTRDPHVRHELRPALDGSRPCTGPMAEIDARVLDAEIALVTGQHPLVRRRLQESVRRAAQSVVVRPLTVAPPALLDRLERDRGSFGELEHLVDRVLAIAHKRSVGAVPVLTQREHEVLELLPTTRSVDEIAEALAVSPNTIKTHQRAIYHKLGAEGRRDAVRRARRAGLLTFSG